MKAGRKKSATQSFEASIDSLAPGGDGVAKVTIDGERRAVFVRGACVGDRAMLDVDASSRPARGTLLRVIESGSDRVEPACAHIAACGGCDWMHVSADAQRRTHALHVRAALPEAWRAFPMTSHEAISPFAYRTRARLHVRVSGGRAIIGMNEAGSREPIEVDTCVVLVAPLDRARAALGDLFDDEHGRGDVQIALTADGRAALDLKWSGNLSASFFGKIERAANDKSSAIAGARIFAGETTKAALIGDASPSMHGADGELLTFAPGGFAQASEKENARLASRVFAIATSLLENRDPALGNPKIIELYSGAGNLTVLLATMSRHLIAIESDRAACEAARKNLALRNLTAKITEADASSYEIARSTDLIVLDPPRKGAREVCEHLAKDPAKNVIYVSCDAQTLGRDLTILATRYEPFAIETFEMFPQTSHVETIVAMRKRRGTRG
jgi:23S rRNA (uracil1939-C5)-methyltransferase